MKAYAECRNVLPAPESQFSLQRSAGGESITKVTCRRETCDKHAINRQSRLSLRRVQFSRLGRVIFVSLVVKAQGWWMKIKVFQTGVGQRQFANRRE